MTFNEEVFVKVTTIRYATVGHPEFWADFRIYPNGDVHKWEVSSRNINGYWRQYGQSEMMFNEIQQIGLEALKNEPR